MINHTAQHNGIDLEITKQGYSLYRLDNVWVSSNDIEVQKIIDAFDSVAYVRGLAKVRITAQAEAVMIGVELQYPSFARQTWTTQKIEAESYQKDINSLTPTLDLIALNREVDRVTLINKTLIKVAEYNTTAATLEGKRQKLEDDIDNSTDLDYINSINFEA